MRCLGIFPLAAESASAGLCGSLSVPAAILAGPRAPHFTLVNRVRKRTRAPL
jgi:hypothetical protein